VGDAQEDKRGDWVDVFRGIAKPRALQPTTKTKTLSSGGIAKPRALRSMQNATEVNSIR